MFPITYYYTVISRMNEIIFLKAFLILWFLINAEEEAGC